MNRTEEPIFSVESLADARSLAEMTTDDSLKTRSELIGELVRLRRRIADLQQAHPSEAAQTGGPAPRQCAPCGDGTMTWYLVDAEAPQSPAPEFAEHRLPDAEASVRRRFMEEVSQVCERDRRLVACEIHDGLVQDATGALMHLEAVLETGQVAPGPAREQIAVALGLVRKAVGEGRRLIGGLRPAVLDEFGVVAAIERLIREQPTGGPSIELIVGVPPERLESLLETAVYRIVQEAIANVRRHSGSDRAEVRLSRASDRIHIEIRDWGQGFDPARVEEQRLGLQGIRERARLLGGRGEIDSAPGEGTRVFVELPLAYACEGTAITNDRSIE